MDGSAAIDRNLEALKRILAALIAMAGLGDSLLLGRGDAAGAKTLPRHLHRAVLRILRPAEAATRRLIIALARGVVVDLKPPHRAKPKPKSVFLRKAGGTGIVMPPKVHPAPAQAACQPANRPFTLPLCDPLRDPFRSPPRRRPVQRDIPRISFFDGAGRTPIVLKQPPSQDDRVDAAPLGRRLAGLASALDDLPKHIRRFARWRARRDHALQQGKIHRLRPLRPGAPSATRRRGKRRREIDEVLTSAHALAWWALEHPDTS